MVNLENYRERIAEDIRETVGDRECQPIIFAGSGLSIRYFSGPSWDQLLQRMADKCPKLQQNYGYYRQTRDELETGQLLAEKYAEWAWDKNEGKFLDNKLLDHDKSQEIYLKDEICEYFIDNTPQSVAELSEEVVDDSITLEQAKSEIEQLREIQPHAVITTNYDQFLERIFNPEQEEDRAEDKYNVVVGEEILKTQYKSVGEILKIHGSATDPDSLILTTEDYREFNSRKRYLSSKMLTYFAEHPLLIVGYSATDSNVQRILSWVNQALPADKEMADDIYFIEWDEDVEDRESISGEKRIHLNDDSYIIVNRIVARDFDWIFKAFASSEGFEADVRYLRKLVSNMYEVVRNRTPRAKVVDHQQLEDVAKNPDELATVLGISSVGDETGVQFNHDYRPTEVVEELDLDSDWDLNQNVIGKIAREEGVNITKFDNKYHVAFYGENPEPRRYSEDALELFREVRDGEEWELSIPEERIPESPPEQNGIEIRQQD